jgi:GNAT superfamily N-acetyltransferase
MSGPKRNALMDFAQSASNAVAQGVSGPVDLIAAGLRYAGLPVPRNALMSSEWMAERGLTRPVQQGAARVLGETAGMVAPTAIAANAARLAAGANQMMANAAAQRGAITAETAPILRAMSRDEFMGTPRIVSAKDAKDLRPRALNSLADVAPVPFQGGRYHAKFSPDGAVVLDGSRPIASYNFGDTLVVDPKYRGQGLGEELVYQWRTFFPAPAKAGTRNKASQAIQEKVWDRIQADLGGY